MRKNQHSKFSNISNWKLKKPKKIVFIFIYYIYIFFLSGFFDIFILQIEKLTTIVIFHLHLCAKFLHVSFQLNPITVSKIRFKSFFFVTFLSFLRATLAISFVNYRTTVFLPLCNCEYVMSLSELRKWRFRRLTRTNSTSKKAYGCRRPLGIFVSACLLIRKSDLSCNFQYSYLRISQSHIKLHQ